RYCATRGSSAPTVAPRSGWRYGHAVRCTRSRPCAPTHIARCTPGAADHRLVNSGSPHAREDHGRRRRQRRRHHRPTPGRKGARQARRPRRRDRGCAPGQSPRPMGVGVDRRIRHARDRRQRLRPAAGSELVVVTAGIARKPGMSRDDLVRTNADIVKQVSQQIKQHCPQAIVVVVSNPLDVMCWVTKQVTGFARERVIGMAGVLDTARYRAFLAEALDVSVEDIQAMVLGGHGDTMVPLVSYTTVSGIPVSQLLDKATLDKIVDRTRNGGAEIVAFLKTGSAYYAPSAAVTQMVEAIVRDKKRLLPCAAWLQGEYGLSGMYCGVPCKLGARGLEQILEVKLTPEEAAALRKSAEAVKETMAAVKI